MTGLAAWLSDRHPAAPEPLRRALEETSGSAGYATPRAALVEEASEALTAAVEAALHEVTMRVGAIR